MGSATKAYGPELARQHYPGNLTSISNMVGKGDPTVYRLSHRCAAIRDAGKHVKCAMTEREMTSALDHCGCFIAASAAC